MGTVTPWASKACGFQVHALLCPHACARCAQVFGYNVDNGIPIVSWYDDPADTELRRLLPFLERLAGAPDVRPLIAQRFTLHQCALIVFPLCGEPHAARWPLHGPPGRKEQRC